MTKVFELEVPEGTGKLRLDAFCSSILTGMSRSRLKTGVQSVQLNGRQAKLSSAVQAGDRISLIWENPLPDVLIPEHIPLRVLYEDDDVIVVNKRAGKRIASFSNMLSGGQLDGYAGAGACLLPLAHFTYP